MINSTQLEIAEAVDREFDAELLKAEPSAVIKAAGIGLIEEVQREISLLLAPQIGELAPASPDARLPGGQERIRSSRRTPAPRTRRRNSEISRMAMAACMLLVILGPIVAATYVKHDIFATIELVLWGQGIKTPAPVPAPSPVPSDDPIITSDDRYPIEVPPHLLAMVPAWAVVEIGPFPFEATLTKGQPVARGDKGLVWEVLGADLRDLSIIKRPVPEDWGPVDVFISLRGGGKGIGPVRVGPVRAPSTDELTASNQQMVQLLGQGKYAEAGALAEQVLAARERVLGPEHPDTLQTVNDLGLLYQVQGRYGHAEPLYRRALTARERTLGPEHPSTLTSVNNLAALYEAQGRRGEAEPLYRRTMAATLRGRGKARS